jgi:hypothetical protein
MILQIVWNECVRFGGHTNMQVSYKILLLEVLKKALILHNPTSLVEWGPFHTLMATQLTTWVHVPTVVVMDLGCVVFGMVNLERIRAGAGKAAGV